MNHRFLLRLVTNLAVVLLALSCFGTVLWVIDEILRWDILPDGWSLLIRALLVAGGIVTFVLVVMNLLLSLALLAEATASRAQLPDYVVSRRLKRRVRRSIVAGVVAIALIIGGLQITDYFRAQAAAREAQAEFTQAQADLDTAMVQVLDLFTPPLLEAIDTNTLVEQGQLGNLSKLFSSIQASFAHSPTATLLVPASQPPFRYARINRDSIRPNNAGRLLLASELYATFPSALETQSVEQLFAGELPAITEPLAGQVINNTLPSTWGVLKRDGQVIAIVYLQGNLAYDGPYSSNFAPYGSSAFHHDGPDSLMSN